MKRFNDLDAEAVGKSCPTCLETKPANAFWPNVPRCKRCILDTSLVEAQARDARNAARKAAEPPKARAKPKGRAPTMTAAPSASALICEAVSPGTTKRCKACRSDKPLEAFGLHPRGAHGRRATCRSCVAGGKGERKATPEQRTRWAALNRKPDAVKKQRAAATRWREDNPAAVAATDALNRAVRRGAVARASCCQILGCTAATQIVGHHHSYDDPLDVLWICRTHHRRLHNGAVLQLIDGLPDRLLGVPVTITSTNRPAPRMTCRRVEVREPGLREG